MTLADVNLGDVEERYLKSSWNSLPGGYLKERERKRALIFHLVLLCQLLMLHDIIGLVGLVFDKHITCIT